MFGDLVGGLAANGGLEFWMAVAFLLVATAGGVYAGYRGIHRARLIEDTPTARVRSAPQGYVELEGRSGLLEGTPIVAPLSGTECVWYDYKVEKREETGFGENRRSRWRTVRSGTSEGLFLLDDATGECVIDPDGADVRGARKRTWYGTTASPAWGMQTGSASLFGRGRYRYVERLLLPGLPLYALGEFRTVGGDSQPMPSVAEETRDLVLAWKRDPQQMARFDADGDGQVDMEEFARLRAQARREVIASRSERRRSPATHLLALPRDGRPFILGAGSQHGLARRYRWQGWGLLAAGMVAGGLLAALIQARLAL